MNSSDSPPEFHLADIDLCAIRYPDALWHSSCTPAEAPDPMPAPPLVRGCASGGYEVVDGCRRIERMRICKQSSCAALVLTTDPGDYAAGRMRIAANRARTLPAVEQFLYARWIVRHEPQERWRDALGRIGARSWCGRNPDILDRAGDDLGDAIADGVLDPAVVPDICAVDDPDDRAAVLRLLREFTCSRQTQRSLLEWLPEIAWAEKTTVKALCEDTDMRRIRTDPALNAPQKIERLRNALFARRFPHFDRMRRRWRETVARHIPAGNAVRLIHDPAFEKRELDVHIHASSGEQMRAVLRELGSIAPGIWEKLIFPRE